MGINNTFVKLTTKNHQPTTKMLKLSQMVCTIPQAKKLRKLGVLQIAYWFHAESVFSQKYSILFWKWVRNVKTNPGNFAAFNVSEMDVMCPEYELTVKKDDKYILAHEMAQHIIDEIESGTIGYTVDEINHRIKNAQDIITEKRNSANGQQTTNPSTTEL